jgi:hypothetical protein
MPPNPIVVLEEGTELAFSFDEMCRYNGGGSPGGVAHAFKVLERALPLLRPSGQAERREILIDTAFGGPGARDGFELATRAVTDGRFVVDPSLARPDLGRTRERFVFRLRYRDRGVTLVLRDGFVTSEFIELAGRAARTPDAELRLTDLKAELAAALMSAPAADAYDVAAAS